MWCFTVTVGRRPPLRATEWTSQRRPGAQRERRNSSTALWWTAGYHGRLVFNHRRVWTRRFLAPAFKFLLKPRGFVIHWLNGNYPEIFPPHEKWNEFSTGPKNRAEQEDRGMCKGSRSVLSKPTKLLNYHQTWNESKETNFRQIIKPLSFMTQSQWKLPSLRLCPAAEEKKRTDMWGNKGMIIALGPVCGSSGTSVHVRHWGSARDGRPAIPEPDWVQIKSSFIIWIEGKQWEKWQKTIYLEAISAKKIISGKHPGTMFPLSRVHLVSYV